MSQCAPAQGKSNTYHMQAELRRWEEAQTRRQNAYFLRDPEQTIVLDEKDPLLHYNLQATTVIPCEQRDPKARPPEQLQSQSALAEPTRILKEQRRILNINSVARQRDTVSSEPRLTAHDTDEETPVPLNHYLWALEQPLSYVKSIRLLSAEIPATLLGAISAENNKIEIALADTAGRAIKLSARYCLPYLHIQIPPGHYDPTELVATLQDVANATVQQATAAGYTGLFAMLYDPPTDAISIRSTRPDVAFYWRFCPHPVREQLSLHYLLGFEDESSDRTHTDLTQHRTRRKIHYVQEWNNLAAITNTTHPACRTHARRQRRPFRPVDLRPYKYLYLAIRGLDTITDPVVRTDLDLFAKVFLPFNPLQPFIPMTNFVHNTKYFTEAPVRRLESLRIDWVDAYGLPVDFQGQEHSFTLEVVQYLDVLADAHLSATRGVTDTKSFTESSNHI